MSARRPALSVDDYVAGVRAGDRATLARAITLVESRLPAHHQQAQEVLTQLLPETGGATRVGLSGSPGVGKSTFIESLGVALVEAGSRVAVLAVDPTSSVTGGSILGDKTRMQRLSRDNRAFIRPSPSAGNLGGVGRRTRETLLLCEAAGFDVVLVETVGVGQSEHVVAELVDFFVLLMLPGGGDELQGIKRGILELADLVAINKADGERKGLAQRSQQQMRAALHLVRDPSAWWQPPVLLVSALESQGLGELWQQVRDHREAALANGALHKRRQDQKVQWMRTLIEQGLMDRFQATPGMAEALASCTQQLLNDTLTPTDAAVQLLERFMHQG